MPACDSRVATQHALAIIKNHCSEGVPCDTISASNKAQSYLSHYSLQCEGLSPPSPTITTPKTSTRVEVGIASHCFKHQTTQQWVALKKPSLAQFQMLSCVPSAAVCSITPFEHAVATRFVAFASESGSNVLHLVTFSHHFLTKQIWQQRF